MKNIKIILFFFLFAFIGNILQAQKNDTIIKRLNDEQEVVVLGLHQPVPSSSKFLGNLKIGDKLISSNGNYHDAINDAKNKARKAGGNIIKITELKEPDWTTTTYYRLKADIFFNDSVKNIPKEPKQIQIKTQDTTSFSRFKIIINPTLMLGQKEYGGIFEYRIKKNFAVEVGLGANVNYTYTWEKQYVAGEGFTARAGMRLYSNSGIYFNPMLFYRRMTYHNRIYIWGQYGYDKQDEPGMVGCHCSGDSGSPSKTEETSDEDKQVFAFEALAGKEFNWRRFTMDVYAGLGVRYKYKKKEIVYDYYYVKHNSYYLDNTTYYSPPKEEKQFGYLPTIQFGFQVGFLSKQKGHLFDSK